jgi:membrane-associated phospholipid phosphatase
LIIAIQMIYLPTSLRALGGMQPKLSIDTFPVWPVWVVPYILCYPMWLAAIGWAVRKMEDDMFRSLIAAFLLTCTVSISIFVFFPTYVEPDTLQGHDIFTVMLRFIHQTEGKYDAVPSGHIYITVLLALFYNLWYPRYQFYWILIPVLVAFSTLFTQQHFVTDVVAGLVIALLGFHFGLRWAGYSPAPHP